MDGDLGRRRDHLVVLTHVGGAKVNENVNDEHDVDYQVNHNCNIRGRLEKETRKYTYHFVVYIIRLFSLLFIYHRCKCLQGPFFGFPCKLLPILHFFAAIF